jgi:hypothetical protein
MFWTPLCTNKHNMCWIPLCTNKQAQYVLDTTVHKKTSTTNRYCVCVCIVVSNTYCVCLCIVVSNTYCACLFVYSGVQHILCLFHNMYWTPLCTNKQAQYVLDTTIHTQKNTICVGHHYTHKRYRYTITNINCPQLFIFLMFMSFCYQIMYI